MFALSKLNHFSRKKSETSFRFSTKQINFTSFPSTSISSTFVSKINSSIFDKSTFDLSKIITHFLGNIHATLHDSPIFHQNFEKICLIFAAVLFLLSVKT
jgi:hypothetical protein